MSSNLPPGCASSQIPGNRPEDRAVDDVIELRRCIACKHCDTEATESPCDDCYYTERSWDNFEAAEEDVIAERLEAEQASREDG